MAEAPVTRAAGAVLWRPGPAGHGGSGAGRAGAVRIALVHRPRYGDWSLPKGKCQPGEHVLLTAVREVAEETGVRVVLGRRLPTARYLSEGLPKRVEYWAARPAAGGGAGEGEFVPNAEVDEVAWLPVAAARERLTYPHDVSVLDAFAAGPPAATPVILARHAVARGKKAWREAGHRDDLARPLTRRGQGQAQALAPILGCFAPERVISSAAERCLATVRPCAALRGTEVASEPAFTLAGVAGQAPGAGAGRAAAAGRERIVGVLASGRPTVICAHRENLPSLLDWACQRLGAPVPGGPPLRKSAFWVLQVSDGRLVSAEQHHSSASADVAPA